MNVVSHITSINPLSILLLARFKKEYFILLVFLLGSIVSRGQDHQTITTETTKLLSFNDPKPTVVKGEILMDLIIEDKKTIASNSFKLYQNDPNPFIDETVVTFELYEKTSLSLTIYDPEGKVLKEYKGVFGKGENTIRVYGKDLKQYGVLYYLSLIHI